MTRTDLLELFKANTGKTTVQPRSEPNPLKLAGYQQPRCDRIRYSHD